MFESRLIIRVLNLCIILVSLASSGISDPGDEPPPVPYVIRAFNHPCEEYEVLTDDGYILSLYRIPNANGIPVLLVHGMMSSSVEFIMQGTDKALAYLLYKRGFDVWMLNCRGSRYSTRHKVFLEEDSRYWQFSFDEIGRYDLPAAIDFVLDKTGSQSLHYIGFSQGTTVFFVMCSERPEYANKIRLMQALGPTVYLSHSKNWFLDLLSYNKAHSLKHMAYVNGADRFFIPNSLIRKIKRHFCGSNIFSETCSSLLLGMFGFESTQFDKSLVPIIMNYFPDASAMRQVLHYVQVKNTGSFARFDYGVWTNEELYSSSFPPLYNLKNTTCKVALHYGPADDIATQSDVLKLSGELPNLIELRRVDDIGFQHMDFIASKKAKSLVYDNVVSLLT